MITPKLSNTLLDFIETINSAKTLGAANTIFSNIINNVVGYENIVFGAITPQSQKLLLQTATTQKTENGRPVILHTCPQGWVDYYFRKNYLNIDPLIFLSLFKREPISWKDVKNNKDLSKEQQLMFEERAEHGLCSGYTFPVHGPQGESYMLSMSTKKDNFNSDITIKEIQILTSQYYITYADFASKKENISTIRLTAREKECLLWTAQGKSAWDISRIIHVSEHTVNFHLKNAIRKLDTINKTAAVVKAIRLGLIYI